MVKRLGMKSYVIVFEPTEHWARGKILFCMWSDQKFVAFDFVNSLLYILKIFNYLFLNFFSDKMMFFDLAKLKIVYEEQCSQNLIRMLSPIP